ncbi:UNVERIFIED_CONTAM: hypothetical protein RMT77_018069 [Armadillidium vulgare]
MKVYVSELILFGSIIGIVYGRNLQRRERREISESSEFEEQMIIPYNYGYEIRDSETQNYQNKAEMMDEYGHVYGSYSVLMPDGIIYTTSYKVTPDSGYVATVSKIPAIFRSERNIS